MNVIKRFRHFHYENLKKKKKTQNQKDHTMAFIKLGKTRICRVKQSLNWRVFHHVSRHVFRLGVVELSKLTGGKKRDLKLNLDDQEHNCHMVFVKKFHNFPQPGISEIKLEMGTRFVNLEFPG